MKWSDLLLVKGQASDCLQTLKYVILLNMLNPEMRTMMSSIHLTPKDDDSTVWEFKKDNNGDLHFVQLPLEWVINIVPGDARVACPFENLHSAVFFLYEIYESIKPLPEWKKLFMMILRLRSELPTNCDLCMSKTSTDPLYHPFMVDAPSPECDKYVERHCHYARKIILQTRKQVRDEILCIIKRSFEAVKDLEFGLREKSLLFKRQVLEDVRKLISFVQTREIDFTEWLSCLLYLDKRRSPEPGVSFQSLMTKMWILLNLYFTEARLESTENLCIYEDSTLIEIEDPGDLEELLSTHPLKRSSILL